MKVADQKIRAAFEKEDALTNLGNVRIGCYLGMLLMPAGFFLDCFVYPKQAPAFLALRLACSILIGVFLLILKTEVGKKRSRQIGICLAMLPALSISAMIYFTEGAHSPYYAGLNLVLLVVGFVLHWTLKESVVAVSLVNLTYLAACLLHDYRAISSPLHESDVINNFYFLILTGIIVAVGNTYHSRLRLREFSLRFQLDENRISLEQAHNGLEEAHNSLESAHKKLVDLDEAKTRFFANISHELRTPLTLLLAPLDAIRAEKWNSLDPETRDWLQTMQANGFRLLRLINELLDLVKLESGNMRVKLEPLLLHEFLQGLVSSIQGAARDKHLRAKTKIDPALSVVLADRDKLEKILLNLLFNAIKFTPASGEILLEAFTRESKLVIKIQDTGMGIKKEELPFIFKRFWQADTSSSRKYQGTGIGLALVKELVEVQSGAVSVDSQVGVGTTMTVTLPLLLPGADSATAAVAIPEPPGANSDQPAPDEPEEKWKTELYRRAELFPSMTSVSEAVRPAQDFSRVSRQLPTLLIADDEPDMLRFLKSQLAGRYKIIEAVDGRQALENARQFIPDVLLVDMMMPEIDGLQVCRELQAQTSTQNIPIILLTARADEETKLTALTAGASDFLTKPFSTTELHVRVKNFVDGHLWQRKLARQNQVLEATIDQLKETETQLVQSEKMASLGRLSAGIIHEINNPLNYAKTGLFTLRRQGQSLPEEKRALFNDILKDIEEGVDRVKTIVSDLRTFTHPNPRDLGDVNLAKLTESALRFMGGDFATQIKMEIDVPAGFDVRGNVNKLLQVLINLLQNAFDALKSKEFTDTQPTIKIQARMVDGKPSLSVRDNGHGIKPEVMDKIFEPFFTTKDVGEGMGLGLSICYRVMEECGGRIYAKSTPGEFCEFVLEFADPTRTATA